MERSKDKDNGKEETQVSWKDCIENLVELERESIKYGNFLTDAIIRVMMKYIQEWIQTTGGKGGKVTCLAPKIV